MKQGNVFSHPILSAAHEGRAMLHLLALPVKCHGHVKSFQNQIHLSAARAHCTPKSLMSMMAGSRIPCRVILTHHRAMRPCARACQDTGSADSSTDHGQPLKHSRETLSLSDKVTTIGRADGETDSSAGHPLIEWQSYAVTGRLGLQSRWSPYSTSGLRARCARIILLWTYFTITLHSNFWKRNFV